MEIDSRGSCLCGDVTFSISGAVDDFYLCHCKRCRKETGSAFATNMFVGLNTVRWMSGEASVQRFELPDADRFCSDFCRRCGSVVPYLSRDHAFYIVPVGTLDDEFDIRPLKQIFWHDRSSWLEAAMACPRKDGYT